jgi:hypothetical protein
MVLGRGGGDARASKCGAPCCMQHPVSRLLATAVAV